MSKMTTIDFQQIRADSVRQCHQINALRDELRTLLTQTNQADGGLTKPPPVPVSKPFLISRVDRIQSRLSFLASTLSPSNKSTPISRPLSADTVPDIFPIGTPNVESRSEAASSSDEEDVVFEATREQIHPKVKAIEASIDSKISGLRVMKLSVQEAHSRAIFDMADRERLNLAALLDDLVGSGDSISNRGYPAHPEALVIELNRIKLQNDEFIERTLRESKTISNIKSDLERLRHVLLDDSRSGACDPDTVQDLIKVRIRELFDQLSDLYKFEISRLKNELDSQLSQVLSTDEAIHSNLVEENQKLKNQVRRFKLAFSKWRMDYLDHARNQKTQFHPPNSVNLGENVQSLLHTLSRMWTALPPSGHECIDLIMRIHDAAESHGERTLADIVKEECSRHVEKLPIAEHAARREFLLAKRKLLPDEHVELVEITQNVFSLISDYERRHRQPFMFDGVEYLQTIHPNTLRP